MSARAIGVGLMLAVLLAGAGCSAPRRVRLPAWDAARAEHVQREVERYFAAHDAGRIELAILRGDSLVLVGGMGAVGGWVDSGHAWANSRYALDDLERQMLAAAALVQVDSGHIALDEPLALRLADDRVAAPTLRELLHQVSGLYARDSTGAWVAEHRPRERWTERGAHREAATEALEAQTGRSVGALMDDAWSRAGLPTRDTSEWNHPRAASVADLARWARALEQGAVVSRERYAEMTRLVTLRDEREWPYGMGLELQTFEGRAKVMHASSAHFGDAVVLARYPQDDVSIALSTSGADAWMLPALERRIARRLFGAPDPAYAAEPIRTADLERAEGEYYCGDLGFVLAAHEGRLTLSVSRMGIGSLRVPLTHIGGGRYVSTAEPDAVHVWIKRGNGPVPELVIGWFGLPCQALRR